MVLYRGFCYNNNMPVEFSNQQIIQILTQVIAAMEVKGEDFFRLNAYKRSLGAIAQLNEPLFDIWKRDQLEALPGVGKALAQHLSDLFSTGHCFHFEQLKHGLPEGMFNLLGLPRVGAKTACKLASILFVTSPQELKEACEKGRVAALEGFGEVSQAKILKGIQGWENRSSRWLLPRAREVASRYLEYLSTCSAVEQAFPLGSLRRGCETVGDIDIAVATTNSQMVVSHFVAYSQIKEVVSQGDQKATVILKGGEQVDLMTQIPKAYGSLLQHFTGSKYHNIRLRSLAKEKGLSLSEYGISVQNKSQISNNLHQPTSSMGRRQAGNFQKYFNEEGGRYEFPDEESFYTFLELPLIPPELREDGGEIEAAQKGQLPNLVQLSDIKGDLQTHTTWSDGEENLESMVKTAMLLGYEYLGVTDHAASVKSLGVSAVRRQIEKQRREVEILSSKYPNFKILFGVECNITAESEMALPDELLALFDFVQASIHTSFDQSKETITKRLLMALNNPYVTCIGHPTGRLIQEREGCQADWLEVFKEAARLSKWLEINAQPNRLDLPDKLARQAKDAGVLLTICTDAHSSSGLNNMDYGVTLARRAWCQKENIVNTQSVGDLLSLVEKSRKNV